MDKLVKFAVILGALLAGGGVFYHYVIYLPAIQQQEAQREAQRAGEQKQETAAQEILRQNQMAERAEQNKREAALRQVQYEICKANALKNYDANWAAACVSFARSQEMSLRNCLSDRTIISNPYMGENYCRGTFRNTDSSPTCTLPKVQADSINQAFDGEQQRCLQEARLGL